MIRPHARRYKWWRSCFNENTWIINNLSSNTAFLISLHLSSCPRHGPIDTPSALESVSPPGNHYSYHTLLFCYFIFMCYGKSFEPIASRSQDETELSIRPLNPRFQIGARKQSTFQFNDFISYFYNSICFLQLSGIIIINYITKVKIKCWSSI